MATGDGSGQPARHRAGGRTRKTRQPEADTPAFHSLDDVHRFVKEESARGAAAEEQKVKLWRAAERMTLVIVLAALIFTVYMLTVIEKIVSLPHLEILPVRLTIRTLSLLGNLQ